MNLRDVMDELAARLDTITGLRVHAQPVGRVTPPAAVLSYPERIEFDATYRRGGDRMSLPLVVVVGRPVDPSTREALGAYCDGTGARSVKAVLESGTYTTLHELTVTTVDFDAVSIAGVDLMAAMFTIDVIGTGS
jgi:hypothetical protein